MPSLLVLRLLLRLMLPGLLVMLRLVMLPMRLPMLLPTLLLMRPGRLSVNGKSGAWRRKYDDRSRPGQDGSGSPLHPRLLFALGGGLSALQPPPQGLP